MVDSQTSPTDDSASFPLPPSLPPPPPSSAVAVISPRPLLKSTGSQSISSTENQEAKQKPFLNNQTAQIVQAKYSYEPLQFSPNDHPEIELPLNIGDYYLIYGDVDEVIQCSLKSLIESECHRFFQDGFYDGRNLEGRYGLIPSNFIEPINNPNQLPEPVRHIIQRLTGKLLSGMKKPNKIFLHLFYLDETVTLRRDQTSSIDSDVFASNTSINVPTTYRKQCKN